MRALSGNLEAAGTGLPGPELVERRIVARLDTADIKGELPLEMKRALARETAQSSHAVAEQLGRDEISLGDLTNHALANLEAVIRVVGRPAWYVRQDVPTPEENDELSRDDEFWIVRIGNAGKALRRVCSRTGIITRAEGGDRVPFGTAWMIGPRTVVTNAHVAVQLTHQESGRIGDLRDGWRMRPGVKGAVNFAFENNGSQSTGLEIEDVLYVQTSRVPDIAVFRLRGSGAESPSPIELDLVKRADWRDLDVFPVGHPIRDLQSDPNVAIVFGAIDGTKRFSPGKLVAVVGGTVLAHDCSTTNGSSGSPIVDFTSLKAVGLHYFGARCAL
jgi:hypothetical protein